MNFDVDVFRDYWHLICHRNELPHSGDYIRLQTVLGDLVVFNDAGDLVAFDNLCPHRGARMFSGIEGNQSATCKYHGWSYNHGRMVIPLTEDFGGCATHTARINKYQVDWCGDFLFVGVSPRQSLYDQLGGTAEVLENISFNIAGRFDFNSYEYQSCWTVAVENALEPYHIGMVHPETLGTLELEAGNNEYHGQNSIWYAPVGNQRLNKQLRMLKKQFAIDFGYEGYMSVYLFPFTMISSTYGYSYSLQHFFPSARNEETAHFSSRLLLAHAASEQAKKIIAPLFASTAQVNRKVFAEDHEVCKLVPRTSWSMEPLKYASVAEEKIGHFRTSCREYVSSKAAGTVTGTA
jgi:phenylpropionate dioxygenase-like ring-hydroxylating dioxygenase large terminal subunit